jgi:hypothetical protein
MQGSRPQGVTKVLYQVRTRIGNINQTPSLMKAHPGAKGRTR